jgi:hypothetical protein
MKTVCRFCVFIILLVLHFSLQAQDRPIYQRRDNSGKKGNFDWNKTFAGITLTPGFGYGGLSIYSSLTGGYQISERFNVSAGPLYMFYQWSLTNTQTGQIYKTDANIWGGRVVSQFILFKGIGLHGEMEVMNAVSEEGFDNLDPSKRQLLVNPLVGITTNSMSNGGFRSFTILYNLNYIKKVTPYGGLFGISDIPIVLRASLYFNLGRQ